MVPPVAMMRTRFTWAPVSCGFLAPTFYVATRYGSMVASHLVAGPQA